jgi:4-diphosphocytidyl-2-C-methyl-D-erythritol kinase
MVVFPNCKINIGLNILDKRQDGFHNLETVFFPVPIKDSLEIIRAKTNSADLIFSQSGIAIEGDTADNLCIKAYHLLKKDVPHLPAIQMHLHKVIPMGAGLGGGSADGAFALRLFNDKFQLNLSPAQLISYALSLGSDCPFFILNQPCFATGRGEIMTALNISLSGYTLVLINPGIHVNTGWAFAQLKNEPVENRVSSNLLQHIQEPINNWRNTIVNDFENAVFKAHPAIADIKNALYSNGAVYASMSGSGSSVFGLFEKSTDLPLNLPAGYFTKAVLL